MTATFGDLGQVDVAVLAGGLGTRLRGADAGLPKVLADVGGETFLDFLLRWLRDSGCRRVVLCLGFRAEAVVAHVAAGAPDGLQILTSIEPSPLGTCGALRHASHQLRSNPVVVINGDSFVDIDLGAALREHMRHGARASIVGVHVADASDCGILKLDGAGFVQSFEEKVAGCGAGLVNAGVYFFSRLLLDEICSGMKSSLEREVLPFLGGGALRAIERTDFFLDIGTPERLAAAAAAFASLGAPRQI